MAIGDDFSIDTSGNIRHVSGSTTYTVLAFHRWLQDLADDAESTGNDLIDITSSTPSQRATDNIITLNSPYNIDDDAAEYLYNGSITQDGGDTIYSGLVVVGSLYGTTTLQVVQNNYLYRGDSPFWGTGLNADATANILLRVLIKTRSGGANIDNQKVRVYAREWGATWAEFEVTMGLGNSTAAIFTNQDLNNATAVGTVGTWSTITNVEGYQGIDLLNGSGTRYYYSQWNRDTYTINQLYERCKYIARRGTSETIHGMDGELFRGITHQWDYDQESGSGSPVEDEELSWGVGTTYGEGVLLALDDNGTTGTMWIQLIRGVPPTDGMQVRGDQSGGSNTLCNVNGSVTNRSVSPVFLGQSTGAALIGAFGIGVEANDLTASDKLFDLTNTQQTPPNNVQFIVYGLVAGQDRVLVTNQDPSSGADPGIDFTQMSLNTALTGASETAVDVGTGNIPADTPQTGVLRIETDGGRYQYCEYTAHDGDDGFTITAESFSGDNASIGNNVFIGYIDKLATSSQESVTIQYDAARTMFVRVRDGGGTPIKTYESTAALGSGGGSATASRISDT